MDPPLFDPESSPIYSDPSTPDRFNPILPPFGINSIIGIDSNSIIPRPEINSIIPDSTKAARFKILQALQINFAKQHMMRSPSPKAEHPTSELSSPDNADDKGFHVESKYKPTRRIVMTARQILMMTRHGY
ncbi:hypothetical protein PtB15_15B273 [Puccinia triticina]|nr:hypothetical protein PtB15_15B273 [Puccinia triticina]